MKHSGGIPYGFKYDNSLNQLVTDKNEVEVIKLIYSLLNKGLSVSAVANELNARGVKPRRGARWHNVTVKYIVASDRIAFYEKHKIVSKDLLSKVRCIDHPNKITQRKRESSLLTNLNVFICSKCGAKIKTTTTVIKEKLFRYYICSNKQTTGLCDLQLHKTVDIDKPVITALNTVLSLPLLTFYEKYKQYKYNELMNSYKTLDHAIGTMNNLDKAVKNVAGIVNDYFDISFPDLPKKITEKNLSAHISKFVKNIVLFDNQIRIDYKIPINDKLEFSSFYET